MGGLVSLNVLRKNKERRIRDVLAAKEIAQNTLNMIKSSNIKELDPLKKELRSAIMALQARTKREGNEEK